MATGKSSERKLTPKQERFCQLYTTYWEATRAAREAGYSAKTAKVQGYQLLRLPLLKARIDELSEHALREIGVSRERILLECARIAYFDPDKALEEDGTPKAIKEMDEDTRRCVSEIEVYEKLDGSGEQRHAYAIVRNVKFVPKKVGLDILKAAAGLNTERIEHSGPGGKPIETRDLSALTDEQLRERLAKLEPKSGEPSE